MAASPESQSSMDGPPVMSLSFDESVLSSVSTDDTRILLQQLCDKDAEIKHLQAENATLYALKEATARLMLEDDGLSDAGEDPSKIRTRLNTTRRKAEQLRIEQDTMQDTNKYLLNSNLKLEQALQSSKADADRSARALTELEGQLRAAKERQSKLFVHNQDLLAQLKAHSEVSQQPDRRSSSFSIRREKEELQDILRQQAEVHDKYGGQLASLDDESSDSSDEEALSPTTSALRARKSSRGLKNTRGGSIRHVPSSMAGSWRCICRADGDGSSAPASIPNRSTVQSLTSLQEEFRELQAAYEGRLLNNMKPTTQKPRKRVGPGQWWQAMVACVTMPFRGRPNLKSRTARGPASAQRSSGRRDDGLGLLLGESSAW